MQGVWMINLECLCSRVDIAPEVNGFPEECWRAENKLRVDFLSGFSPGSLYPCFTQPSSELSSPSGGQEQDIITSHSFQLCILQLCQGLDISTYSTPHWNHKNFTGSGLEQPWHFDRAVIQGGDPIFFLYQYQERQMPLSAVIAPSAAPRRVKSVKSIKSIVLVFEISKNKTICDYINVMEGKHSPVYRISLKFNLW